jgi:predicted  nucleic acid-binding Zn-ribbon protein
LSGRASFAYSDFEPQESRGARIPPDFQPNSRKEIPMGKKMSWTVHAALLSALLLAGCTNAQKEATQAAINAAQSAIDTATSDAEKYAPEQLQAARTALQNAKDALANSDYQGALKAAQDALSKAKDLPTAVAARKDELKKSWDGLNEVVTKYLDAVKAKLDAYSRGAHLPEGMDKTKLTEAKEEYARLKKQWADASADAAKGALESARQKASTLKDQLTKLMEELGIRP